MTGMGTAEDPRAVTTRGLSYKAMTGRVKEYRPASERIVLVHQQVRHLCSDSQHPMFTLRFGMLPWGSSLSLLHGISFMLA